MSVNHSFWTIFKPMNKYLQIIDNNPCTLIKDLYYALQFQGVQVKTLTKRAFWKLISSVLPRNNEVNLRFKLFLKIVWNKDWHQNSEAYDTHPASGLRQRAQILSEWDSYHFSLTISYHAICVGTHISMFYLSS